MNSDCLRSNRASEGAETCPPGGAHTRELRNSSFTPTNCILNKNPTHHSAAMGWGRNENHLKVHVQPPKAHAHVHVHVVLRHTTCNMYHVIYLYSSYTVQCTVYMYRTFSSRPTLINLIQVQVYTSVVFLCHNVHMCNSAHILSVG